MDDLNFSPWGKRVFWVSFGLALTYVVWAAFANSGFPGMMNNYLSPKWTIALLFFPVLILAYTVAALFDVATNQGEIGESALNQNGTPAE